MAGYPDDPNHPDDAPTAYYGQPPEEPVPWYRRPAALVAFGALGAVLIALLVYGLAKLITGDSSPETTPTTLTPLTTTTAAVAPPPETVTETVTSPVTTPTTVEPPPPETTTETTTETTAETTTTVSTVTETVTAPPEG